MKKDSKDLQFFLEKYFPKTENTVEVDSGIMCISRACKSTLSVEGVASKAHFKKNRFHGIFLAEDITAAGFRIDA